MTTSDLTAGFAIYMLPANEGDCVYIQIPLQNSIFFRVLIDCGPVSCWGQALKPFLNFVASAGEKIDLLILTHIDGDHIGGVIPLLADEQYANLIKEVWFNGLHQILPTELRQAPRKEGQDRVYCKVAANHVYSFLAPREQVSAQQALSVSNQLTTRKIPWNTFTEGEALSSSTPSYQIAPDIYIDFLLPNQQGLIKLLSEFRKEVNSVQIGTSLSESSTSRLAFEQVLLSSQEYIIKSVPICSHVHSTLDLKQLSNATFSRDTSITNASSIAVCIRYYDHALLFPGDAHGDDLVSALNKWSLDHQLPLDFAVVKLPHHGSAHNCMSLLDHIQSQVFLVSTDGHKFSHPDKETIAKILVKSHDSKKPSKIYFNYKSKIYQLFTDLYRGKPIAEQICFIQDGIPLFREG